MILLLQRFFHEYESTASRVVTLIQENQPEKAAFLLHKVQGACLMIGANQLAECAQQLETEVDSGIPSINFFEVNLNTACQTIKSAIML